MPKTVTSIAELETEATTFLNSITLGSAATIVCLKGDLGAGKTTFTQAVAKIMGVSETVTSPTFVIEKIYELANQSKGFNHLIHIDTYRLASADELAKLGFTEIINDPANLIFIEWPERVKTLLADREVNLISFSHVNETTRSIHFEKIYGQNL